MLLESDKHVPVFNLVFLEGLCKLQNILTVTGNFCTLVRQSMFSCWLPRTKTRKLWERKFQFKELVEKIRFWHRKAGCWRAPGGRPGFSRKRKGQITSEAGMWPLQHSDWFWGFSSVGPSAASCIQWQGGIALPRSALSSSVPLPAPHSLLLGGLVSPGRNLPYLLPQPSPLLSVPNNGESVAVVFSGPASPVEAGGGNGNGHKTTEHMKMLT